MNLNLNVYFIIINKYVIKNFVDIIYIIINKNNFHYETYKCVKFIRFPIEHGIEPSNLLLLR